MFLSKLDVKQKNLFLDVCIAISKCDDDFCEKEASLIGEFCNEMAIDFRDEIEHPVEEAIEELAVVLNSEQKKMVLLETAGIVMVDKVIAPKEKAILENMIASFGLSRGEYEKILLLINRLYDCYALLANYIRQ